MHQLNKSKIKKVWEIFKILSDIPRGSGNEKAVSDWIVGFCTKKELFVVQDKQNNILIRKEATKGYESFSPLILQGHIDMVTEKTQNTVHDFLKDPLQLKIENGFLMAEGTTLGADNGIGVALILAFLATDEFSHPALEILLTTEEETTMNGAKKFDYTQLCGRHLISLDHTKEGEMLTASAGFVKLNLQGNFNEEPIKKEAEIEIIFDGLKGGHSGDNIVTRPSAFYFLSRMLSVLSDCSPVRLIELECGSKVNAIARDFKIKLCIPIHQVNKVTTICAQMEIEWNEELASKNEKITVHILKGKGVREDCLTESETKRCIHFLMALPHGMQTMTEIPEIAESSLNIGMTSLKIGHLNLGISVRSNIKHREVFIVNRLKALAAGFHLQLTVESMAPMFSSEKSMLSKLCADVYQAVYQKPIMNKKIHAAVEAGVFQEKVSDMDIILIAPDLFDIHSPSERVDIQSTERTWDFLVELIKNARFEKKLTIK